MARLVGGITGRAAGTCAGVQLFRARRGSGNVTAVRAMPKPPETWSAAQEIYRLRMQEIRRIIQTFTPIISDSIRAGNTNPFGWFADWFRLIAPQISPGAPLSTLATTGYRLSPFGSFPTASMYLSSASTTSLWIRWSANNLLPGQLLTDQLYFILLTCSKPWDRTSAYYRAESGSGTRSGTLRAISGLAASQPAVCIAWFKRAAAGDTHRDGLQLLTIST